MVDPKPAKSVAKPGVKASTAKPVEAAAKASAAKPVAAQAKPATPAKAEPLKAEPVKTAPKPAPAPVAAKPTAAPAAKVTPPPAKPLEAAKPAVASPAPAPKIDAVAPPKPTVPTPEPVAAKIVAEPAEVAVSAAKTVADVTAKVAEKAAAAPVAAAKAFTPPPAAQPIEKGIFAMAETVTPQSFVPTPENIQALFGDMSTRAKAVMENSAKLAEEMGEFTKGNVEALMTSSRLAAKGAETLGQEAASYSKKSLESATAAFKGFASAKSPTELFKLQSDYARSSFDAAVAEGSKFSEAMMKLFGEITQPISTRVAMAAEKIKTPAF